MITDFIVVDDDQVGNMICRKTIEKIIDGSNVKTFDDADSALSYIQPNYAKGCDSAVILLLDINMPVVNGWEFLDQFEQFDPQVKNCIKIYMLSSSIDPGDKERAATNRNVSGYVVKPLTKEKVQMILSEHQ